MWIGVRGIRNLEGALAAPFLGSAGRILERAGRTAEQHELPLGLSCRSGNDFGTLHNIGHVVGLVIPGLLGCSARTDSVKLGQLLLIGHESGDDDPAACRWWRNY